MRNGGRMAHTDSRSNVRIKFDPAHTEVSIYR